MDQPALPPLSPIIRGRLYQGGWLSPPTLIPRADLHVACAQELPPDQNSAHEVVFFPLDDYAWTTWSENASWCRQVAKVASRVAFVVKHRSVVLVTCHAGLNRSGLVVALALCRLGMSPKEAILLVREMRSERALSNPEFIRVVGVLGQRLRSQPPL